MSPRGSAPLVRSGSVNRLWTTSGDDEQVHLWISRLCPFGDGVCIVSASVPTQSSNLEPPEPAWTGR